MAQAGSADLPDGESEIFFAGGMDKFWVICPTGGSKRVIPLSPASFRGAPKTVSHMSE
jgi:hypothetical protein